jgi:hypothetical protein
MVTIEGLSMDREFRKVNIKALRLIINTLRRAEEDFLSQHVSRKLRASARSCLFGIKESPLPSVCAALGINVSAARLLLLQWRAQKKTGDPLFGYLLDPRNLIKIERGLPISTPDFESVYAGNDPSRQK